MQRVVLTVIMLLSLVTTITARPNTLADKVLDLLTYPGASDHFHRYRHSTPITYNTQPNQSCPVDGRINPDTFDLSKLYYLTDTDYPLDGVYKSLQPVLVSCVPTIHNETFEHYLNGSWVKVGEQAMVWCTCEASRPGGAGSPDAGHDGIYGGGKPTNFIRFHSNLTTGAHLDHYIKMKTGLGEMYVKCYNTSTLTTYSAVFSSGPTPHYCYLEHNGTSTYLGILPPSITEVSISEYGAVYVNGYLYFNLGTTVQMVMINVTTQESLPHGFYSVFYANVTQVLVNVSEATINNLLYCDESPYNTIACDSNQFEPSNGFYSTSRIANTPRKTTYVTMPSVSNHSYYGVTLNVTKFGTGGGHVYWNTTSFDTLQLTIVIKKAVVSGSTNTISYQHNQGNCPWALNNINNYFTAKQIQPAQEHNATCCTDNIASWFWGGRTVSFNFKVCFFYLQGTGVTLVPKPQGTSMDQSVIYTHECVDYNIYGKTGTGVITQSNVTILPGRTYTSASGQLIAFKYLSNQTIYTVTPCDFSTQVAVYNKSVIAAILPQNKTIFGLTNIQETPNFYIANKVSSSSPRGRSLLNVMSHVQSNCTPVLTYAQIGVCADGTFVQLKPLESQPMTSTPIVAVNISIPKTFNISVQTEYIQISTDNILIDCARYVCNGNPRCNLLLSQYQSACSTIEQALHQKARLESLELTEMLAYSPNTLSLANLSNFQSNNMGFNLTNLIPQNQGHKRSVIEDILFSKVVTSGLGTVDVDYKKCTKGISLADLPCAQYYNGIMVLPGVADGDLMAAYTASLTGGMVFGGLTSAAAIPFSVAVQARLNYVALQTDVLQRNQQILAESFNNAMGNITLAFKDVKDAIATTADAVRTVASALDKIQQVVNTQGQALSKLTGELQRNFQAISASIEDIYNRLNGLEADAQVDRLITGRLAALNAFLTQTLTQANQVKQARLLAQQKVNECVKDQSKRYGFCGNGYHLFSIANAAPKGFIFFHTVLQPETTIDIQAVAGFCVNDTSKSLYRHLTTTFNGYNDYVSFYSSSDERGDAYIARDTSETIFLHQNGTYMITPRKQYQPRVLSQADIVKISTCDVTYVNLTSTEFEQLIPGYIDVNSTVEGILNSTLPGLIPDLNVDHYNNTILNLTTEINDLQQKANNLSQIASQLEEYINNINNTLVDLEWLNRVETYLKWPWYVWLAIALAFTGFVTILITIFLCTGCCGGCFNCCGGCFGLFSKKVDPMRQMFTKYEASGTDNDSIPIIYKKNW